MSVVCVSVEDPGSVSLEDPGTGCVCPYRSLTQALCVCGGSRLCKDSVRILWEIHHGLCGGSDRIQPGFCKDA